MMTFYAAAGSYRFRNSSGRRLPFIQKLGKLHAVSVPEFLIWSILLWDVLTYEELKAQYDDAVKDTTERLPDFDEMLELLVRRKLVLCGKGYTGRDALFSMVSDAFVIPYCLTVPRKAWRSFRLWLFGRLSIADIFRLIRSGKDSEAETRVIRLTEQTPLSTAELIRCFERGVYDVSSADKVIAAVYPDDDSVQARIANEETWSEYRDTVLQTVSDLYLSRKIILEPV